jgi:hypothetical protein
MRGHDRVGWAVGRVVAVVAACGPPLRATHVTSHTLRYAIHKPPQTTSASTLCACVVCRWVMAVSTLHARQRSPLCTQPPQSPPPLNPSNPHLPSSRPPLTPQPRHHQPRHGRRAVPALRPVPHHLARGRGAGRVVQRVGVGRAGPLRRRGDARAEQRELGARGAPRRRHGRTDVVGVRGRVERGGGKCGRGLRYKMFQRACQPCLITVPTRCSAISPSPACPPPTQAYD